MHPALAPYVECFQLDEASRIIITLQPLLRNQLSDAKIKKAIKDGLAQLLGADFKLLEIGPTGARITVESGKEEKCMALIETKMADGVAMAMAYMKNLQKSS